MKRLHKLVSIILIFCLSLIICGCGEHTITEKYSLIRIHIRANSNSNADQEVKLKVRDAVTTMLNKKLDGITDFETAFKKLDSLLSEIEVLADKTLNEEGFSYTSRARLNNEFFPTRIYENVVVESGYYDALIIELGNGKGDNWWCVIYPPLCYLTSEGEKSFEYKSYIAEIFQKFFGEK